MQVLPFLFVETSPITILGFQSITTDGAGLSIRQLLYSSYDGKNIFPVKLLHSYKIMSKQTIGILELFLHWPTIIKGLNEIIEVSTIEKW